MRLNSLLIGDGIYELSKAYRTGAQAMRDSVSFRHNPYRNTDSQEHYDWECGHTNEAEGEHFRFGVDVINAPLNGRYFEEDSTVPRDKDGCVDSDWYRAQIIKEQ